MKNLLKLSVALFLLASVLLQSKADAQTNPEDPRFMMSVKNIHTTNPSGTGGRDSIVRFEIWMQQINQGQPGVNDFEYCAGQFTWTYNRAIQQPGTALILGLFPAGSSLPPALRPPSFQVDSINGYLKMSGNLPNSLINFFISGSFPGTRILTGQLRTTAANFPLAPFNLRFKLDASPNTFVAYFLPYPDSVDSEQFPSQTAVALMDTVQNIYSCENFAFPVEMSSFTANVNKNIVTLNWTTTTEMNNQGFDIERQDAKGETQGVWTKAGYVSGNGTTTESKSYSFSERLSTGHYKYRLKQIDFNGSIEYHSLNSEVAVGIPTAYSISQNYPNPFNPMTKIDFEIPYDGKVSILLYDISGREVGKLVNQGMTAGYHTIQFDGSNLSSGMYFYRINAESGRQNFAAVKKMVLVK